MLVASAALAYYADIAVTVDETGLVTIEGITDHPQLLVKDSPDFTSKKGKYWLLNISPSGTFSDLAYDINLPKGSVVNYLKLPTFGHIEEHDGISISGASQNTGMVAIIQYQIIRERSRNLFWWWFIPLLILLGIAGFFTKSYLKKRSASRIDFSRYVPRQKKILKLLVKHGGEITQAKLERLTGLPKSSLSRNIDSLVRKEVIEKFNKGMSNTIRLRKQ